LTGKIPEKKNKCGRIFDGNSAKKNKCSRIFDRNSVKKKLNDKSEKMNE